MRSREDRQGAQIIGVVVTATVLIIAVAAYLNRAARADERNCIGRPERTTVIVIDRSDGVAKQTLTEIKARMLSFISDSIVPNRELVTVFAVDDTSATQLSPLMSLCRPRTNGSSLTENPRAIQLAYVEKFKKPFDSVMTRLGGKSQYSPIAQTLTDISLSEYLSSDQKSLLVFSDLLENTKKFSLYRCNSSATGISEYRASVVGAIERPAFHNARIRLHVIPRFDFSRDVLRCRDTFWNWFFGNDSGPAANLDVRYLPGGETSKPTRP